MAVLIGAEATTLDHATRRVGVDVKRLAYLYVWLTVALGGVVFSEPAPYDALMVGAMLMLPVAGLVRFSKGIAFYLLLWALIVAGGFVATAQAGLLEVPAKHMGITLYLALSSVVMAAFVLDRPGANVRLIMSAYVLSALVAATAGLIGYFALVPGTAELFADGFGRVRGTFKDPNVLGAYLVPALLYVLNLAIRAGAVRAAFWLAGAPVLLLACLLASSRGAWANLAVSLAVYAYLAFASAGSHRRRLKLMISVVLGTVFAVGLFAAAISIPRVAELLGERAALEQPYDVGPEGRFGGQQKALGLIVTHPLGIGALEFGRVYHHEDVHEVYLSMFLNAGWLGGALYLAAVLITVWLGLQHVVKDRGGDGVIVVLVSVFIGMAVEGLVVDTDHWRHFYLVMAMIWGTALAARDPRRPAARGPGR
jgi:hypothetical protein